MTTKRKSSSTCTPRKVKVKKKKTELGISPNEEKEDEVVEGEEEAGVEVVTPTPIKSPEELYPMLHSKWLKTCIEKYEPHELNWLNSILKKEGDKPIVYLPKTLAKKVFRITPTQISQIKDISVVPNPKYTNAAPMQLLNVYECFALALKRHKSVENIELYEEKLKDRKKQREENKINETKHFQQRLIELKLKPRSDSKLYQLWMSERDSAKRQGWTEETVLKRLCQVRYLFDHCPAFLQAYQEVTKRKAKDKEYLLDHWNDQEEHECYHMNWDNVDMVRMAEKDCQVVYPSVWPWLE